ncbi:MAG: hypothetical protein CM15mP58_17390 [Burkholderiaceae bacterium]|nr:MAG: hypothetical protein CM15mP58_17390 [Burkholderiaceae bacterium]
MHKHKVDHIAHLGPSVAAGIGSIFKIKYKYIYQAVQQALHTTISPLDNQEKVKSQVGKAYAPAHAEEANHKKLLIGLCVAKVHLVNL